MASIPATGKTTLTPTATAVAVGKFVADDGSIGGFALIGLCFGRCRR